MSLFGKIGDFLANPGKLFGTNFDIGEAMNDVTGTSQSARQQYKYNQNLQTDAQNFNAQQAQIERDWQTQMSNTARQRAVSDLQSAGLNPVLATGAEASSGAGAAATSPGATTGAGISSGNPISMISELVNASNNSARTETDIKNSTNLTDAEVIKALADAKKAGADKDQIDAIIQYYKDNGVFPGATTTKSNSTPWGSSSETIPVGLKTKEGTSNSARKAVEQRKDKEKEQKYLDNERWKLYKEYGGWWY